MSNQVRIAVLSQAHMHAHGYSAALAAHSGAEIVGIWDEMEDPGRALAEANGTKFYPDLDALLSEKLDGVVIASENIHHRKLTEAAAAAGVRAILCEKPIATTVADAEAMIAACAASGTTLAIAFPCRFSPVAERLKATIDSGKLGKILALRATNHGKCPFGWFVEPDKSGGGAIIDHTVHVADLNRVLLGIEATQVYAESGNNLHHQSWEDCGMLTIDYANGIFCTLDSSWSRPSKSFPAWGDVTIDVMGTDGHASMDMFRQTSMHYAESDGGAHEIGWGSSCDAGMIDAFLALASGGESPAIATGHDGLQALKVALAAYESAKTHRVARIA
jgi:predicted dehydrogenase